MAPRRAAALPDGTPSLREHLITTAARLIAEHGTATLTVRAIARAAGVADGVLYNHFADKEELLARALLAHVHHVERALGPLPEPGTATVEANLRDHLDHGMAMHRAILPAFAGLIGQPAVYARFAALHPDGGHWRDRLADYLCQERELGRLAPDADMAAATALLVGVCHDAVLATLLPFAPSGDDVTADSVITVVMRGIGR